MLPCWYHLACTQWLDDSSVRHESQIIATGFVLKYLIGMATGRGGSEWAMASILQGENQVTNIDFHADGNYLISASKEGEYP